MTSTYIKACLSSYFRFRKSIKFIATEVGRYNSDFLAITKDKLIEVEIKTSKSDLNNDFKKPKHKIYETARSDWTPTYFYFAVPTKLVEYALTKCVDKNYGVLEVKGRMGKKTTQQRCWRGEGDEELQKRILRMYDGVTFLGYKDESWGRVLEFEYDAELGWEERVRVVKQARKLTNRPPPNKIRHAMIARLSSEMANLRIREQLAKEKKNK